MSQTYAAFLEHHCDLTLNGFLFHGLAAGAQFLCCRGSDTFTLSRFSRDQPPFLEQLGHQFSHKLLSDAVFLCWQLRKMKKGQCFFKKDTGLML